MTINEVAKYCAKAKSQGYGDRKVKISILGNAVDVDQIKLPNDVSIEVYAQAMRLVSHAVSTVTIS